jgi:hypothetical protein
MVNSGQLHCVILQVTSGGKMRRDIWAFAGIM